MHTSMPARMPLPLVRGLLPIVLLELPLAWLWRSLSQGSLAPGLTMPATLPCRPSRKLRGPQSSRCRGCQHSSRSWVCSGTIGTSRACLQP